MQSNRSAIFEDGIPTLCPDWKDVYFEEVNAGAEPLSTFKEHMKTLHEHATTFKAVEAIRRGLACYAKTSKEKAAITAILDYVCDYSIFPKGSYSMEACADHEFEWVIER